jgi:predicted PurR-regulated permease PerM
MKHDMVVLACFPPVFVAMIMGFTMAVYAANAFGTPATGAAIAAAIPPGWWLARRLSPRELLIAIYLAWSVSLVLAFLALGFPDRP